MGRVRRVENHREMEKTIDEYMTRGYKLQERGTHNAQLKQKDWGSSGTHLIIALFTIWWTFGLANTLYAIFKRVTAEEVIIKIETEPVTDETYNSAL